VWPLHNGLFIHPTILKLEIRKEKQNNDQ
jgi:hypothetical protein